MAKVAALYETRNFYCNFINFSNPLSFQEWNSLPRDHKAITLFLQFFNEIVLAWDKANTLDFIDCEEGVEIINQYLEKNVSIIENDPKRFTPSYIYRVAYNCMYCICHDRKCDKERLANETSAIVMNDGKELNLLDLASTGEDASEESEYQMFQKEFWAVIEDYGLEAEKVMRYLISNNADDLKKISKRNKNYKADPLSDVEVSLEDAQNIISTLREKFSSVSSNSRLGQKLLELNVSFS